MSVDRAIDLEAELAEASATLPAWRGRIAARVAPMFLEAKPALLGIAHAEFSQDGEQWHPSDRAGGGAASLVIACRADASWHGDSDHPNPRWCALAGPEVVDLVAIPLHAPQRWARRTGLAITLGYRPFLKPATTRVYRTPAGWLRGDGAGIAPLERGRAAVAYLIRQMQGGVVADDEIHRAHLHAIASQPLRVPPIVSAATQRAMLEAAE